MDDKLQNIFGYIEGYYGKLLTWEYRFKIIKELKIIFYKKIYKTRSDSIEFLREDSNHHPVDFNSVTLIFTIQTMKL